ncbi:uncharacterized protein RSE6_13953 [Rhynchosporium secalis]|uniref:Uncharacterized protein n=1 Tax=Rhynchosporium secalis TaxID=38038 RepID=A0A1E1MU57_RHYSE|nr:uncharacterized protein RSE6_13953 [Rhynchosporium secalis]
MHLLEKYKASGLSSSLASVNKLDSVAETNTTVVPRFLILHSTTTKSLQNGLRHLNVPTALISNLNSTANVSRSSFQPHSYSIITVFRILSQFAPNSIVA